jgi:hypothetical protein
MFLLVVNAISSHVIHDLAVVMPFSRLKHIFTFKKVSKKLTIPHTQTTCHATLLYWSWKIVAVNNLFKGVFFKISMLDNFVSCFVMLRIFVWNGQEDKFVKF